MSSSSNQYKSSSVSLEGGGDTQFHQHEGSDGGNAVTVTTRLPGGVDVHDTINESDIGRDSDKKSDSSKT
jgi:hypothetical protein